MKRCYAATESSCLSIKDPAGSMCHDDITVVLELAAALIPVFSRSAAFSRPPAKCVKLTIHCRINIDMHTVHGQDESLNMSADKDNTMTCWRLKSKKNCDRTSYEPRVNSTTPEPDWTSTWTPWALTVAAHWWGCISCPASRVNLKHTVSGCDGKFPLVRQIVH